MRGKLSNKIKQNRAFTLMESLIVVAVMVILMGISIVGLQSYTTSLKMTELDNYAKTIYLEVQNQLIAEKIDGGLSSYAQKVKTERVDNKLGNIIESAPADYPEGRGEEWKELYYLGKKDELMKEIISDESYLYDEVKDYVIEFNPDTGIVYGVFCWEKDTSIHYVNDISRLERRDIENRTDARIGYYGGTQSEILGESTILNQKVELINDEELYLKISYPKTPELITSIGNSLNITYEISDDEDGDATTGNSFVKEITAANMADANWMAASNVHMKNAVRFIEVYILLDSMEDGMSIQDTSNPDIDWTKELTITVTSAFYNGLDVYKETNDVKGNGLFANGTGAISSDFNFAVVETEGDEEDELEKRLETNTQNVLKNRFPLYNDDVYYVEVSTLRHLRNLDKLNNVDQLIVIGVTDEIDFNNGEFQWTFEDGKILMSANAKNPLSNVGFKPITNSVITNPTVGVIVEGNNSSGVKNSAFQNFLINGTNGTGIFSVTNKVSFCNIIIEDITVNGQNHVGALVGAMSGGDINNCGVYLTTYTRGSGISTHFSKQSVVGYENEMERRYETYKINGTNNVGGLVGSMIDVNVEEGYAAIRVAATGSNVGGLIGSAGSIEEKKYIRSSYASGEVIGRNNVGGFLGNANNVAIGGTETQEDATVLYGVYASGDVYADETFGGFVGLSTDSIYNECIAYGAIEEKDGEKRPFEVNGGGFVGVTNNDEFVYELVEDGDDEDEEPDKVYKCTYLTQIGHNDDVKTNENISSKAYKYYLADATNDLIAGTSFPYKYDLNNKSFPFAEGWTGQQHHYGNWPAQYVINTSLVYYEKYEDDTYGFYCVTHLAGSTTQWLLNTLKDEIVIDDGYAILSKYNLDSLDYTLQIGSVVETSGSNVKTERLPVSKREQDGALIQLQQQGEIEFKAYDVENDKVLTGANANSFVTKGMYLYQLPYELQYTTRYGVGNFYDRFTINAGYLYDGNEDETDNFPIIKDMTFFYCPHFAKTAVNPNVNEDKDFDDTLENPLGEDGNHSLMDDQLSNPKEVAVRSARQLNALGRYQYYWNTKGGFGDKITFMQETDISFSAYAGIEKKYCGRTFNLLAFDQEYSNRPIGDPDNPDVETSGNGFNYAQFENNYNGCGNKIIDYCVKSGNQYVGLFGEIYRSHISNIVMVVSDENQGNTGTYMDPSIEVKDQNNAGIIIGEFQDDKKDYNGNNIANNQRRRTGVGALLGLDYTVGDTGPDFGPNVNPVIEDGNRDYTIANCAVAGYTVEYHINELADDKQHPLGIALGGFAGFSFGNITNCTAVNDVRLVVRDTFADDGGNDSAVFIGGFAGAFYFATINDSYSGGTIIVDDDNVNGPGYEVFRMRIGGFCPGWMETPAYENEENDSTELVRYEHVYTYTKVDPEVWHTIEDYDKSRDNYFMYLIPSVSRMYITHNGTKWETKTITGSDRGVRVPGMSYYLDSFFDGHEEGIQSTFDDDPWLAWTKDNYDDVRDYYESSPVTTRVTTYDYLSNIQGLRANERVKEVIDDVTYIEMYDGHEVEISYPDSLYLDEKDYPFPAVVKDADGKYVHYGDWPIGNQEDIITNYPAYFEVYEGRNQDTYGYYYVKADGTVVSTLTTDDSVVIKETGYGYISANPTSEEKANAPFTVNIKQNPAGGTYRYYMVPKTEVLGTTTEKQMVIPFNYGVTTTIDGVVHSSADTTLVNLYMNPSFAAAISLEENVLATEDMPLQVRTQKQLMAVDDFADHVNYIQMKQTHSIPLDDTYTSVSIKHSHVFDGNQFAIRNNKTTIFENNSGIIKNVMVTNSNISTNAENGVAIFVNTNNGLIDHSSVVAEKSYDEINISGNKVYGFVANNTGTIQYSFVTGTVTGQTEAAGFAGVNTGTINYSYANTSVSTRTRNAEAAGFVIIGGKVEKSYAAGRVNSRNAYGFMREGTAINCYTISEILGNRRVGFAASNEGNNCFWAYDRITEYNTGLIRNINNPPEDAVSLRDLMRNPEQLFGVVDFADEVSPDYPYSAVLGVDYPYPSVGLAHYGDWKAPSVETANDNVNERWLESRGWKHAGIFYYERYMDGTYGIYAKGIKPGYSRQQVVVNTLADADEPVISSGYGVFYYDNGNNRNWFVNRRFDITDFENNVLEGFDIPGLDNNYVFRYINQSELREEASYSLSHTNTWTYAEIILTRNEINASRPETQ